MTPGALSSTGRALLLPVALLAALLGACSSDTGASTPTPTTAVVADIDTDADVATTGTTTPTAVELAPIRGSFTPVIVATFPHDPTSYTQGLEFVDGRLLESAGRYGESDRRLVDISTGTVLDREALPDDVFAEGLTVVGSEIVQLTWRAETVFRSDLDSLEVVATQSYRGEGWGICNDGAQLVMSNGSAELTFRDPATFEPTRTVSVTRNDGTPVSLLNELECIAGQVWANVYQSDEIVVIDPESGRVDATIDASILRPPDLPIDDADFALNGIAHDPRTGHLYLTGKWWPVLYEVDLEPS